MGLKTWGRATLAREGVRPEDTAFLRQVDARYAGQSYELTIPLPGEGPGDSGVALALERFHAEHDRAYGYSAPGEPVEFVNLRLTATGRIARPRLREVEAGGDAASARKAVRPVYFAERGGYVDCPIYDRYRLRAGCAVEGPAVVEEIDSTTVIHPGYRVRVDRFGNLILTGSEKG